jgi:hypothetical protein
MTLVLVSSSASASPPSFLFRGFNCLFLFLFSYKIVPILSVVSFRIVATSFASLSIVSLHLGLDLAPVLAGLERDRELCCRHRRRRRRRRRRAVSFQFQLFLFCVGYASFRQIF